MRAFNPGMNNTTFIFSKTSTPALGSTLTGYRRFFPRGVKRPESQTDHSPPYSAEVTNVWSYTHLPTYTFMAWTQILCSWWSSDITEILPRHNAARVTYTFQTVIKSAKFLHAYSHTFVRTATTEPLLFANWKFKNETIHKYTFVLFVWPRNLVNHIYGRTRNGGN
jgi:hypothetical protein